MTNDFPSNTLIINGLKTTVNFSEKDINETYLPLLKHVSELHERLHRRVIVYLAAPPGCGKSTLATFLEQLSESDSDIASVQAAGIDGFHYPNSYLTEHTVQVKGQSYPMIQFKGSPDTFDISHLAEKISELCRNNEVKWPIYSRLTHDPEEDGLLINSDIVIIEGNYLLDPDERWSSLLQYADYTVFMYNDSRVLKKRLIERKISGGSTVKEAESHYWNSDRLNVNRVLGKHNKANLTIRLGSKNNILSVEKSKVQ